MLYYNAPLNNRPRPEEGKLSEDFALFMRGEFRFAILGSRLWSSGDSTGDPHLSRDLYEFCANCEVRKTTVRCAPKNYHQMPCDNCSLRNGFKIWIKSMLWRF